MIYCDINNSLLRLATNVIFCRDKPHACRTLQMVDSCTSIPVYSSNNCLTSCRYTPGLSMTKETRNYFCKFCNLSVLKIWWIFPLLNTSNTICDIRRSFQCCDRTTKSYHFCHAFAVQNRLDTSVLSDGASTGTLSSEAILPSSNDLERIIEDFKVLVSRFVEYQVWYLY